MSDFRTAVNWMLKDEDYNLSGVVTPEPHGARARFGINSLAHPEAEKDGFYDMPRDEALEYADQKYAVEYWTPLGLQLLENQNVANKVLDIAVNTGIQQAMRIVVQAMDKLGFNMTEQFHDFGLIFKMVNAQDPARLLIALGEAQLAFYEHLWTNNPQTYGKYKANWTARAKRGTELEHADQKPATVNEGDSGSDPLADDSVERA